MLKRRRYQGKLKRAEDNSIIAIISELNIEVEDETIDGAYEKIRDVADDVLDLKENQTLTITRSNIGNRFYLVLEKELGT